MALTSKPELHIRDRLAFELHSRLEATNRVVAREWHRADIAILSQGCPEAIVELKALSLFAILNQRNLDRLLFAMQSDAAKARSLCGDGAEVYLLLIAAHAESVPAPLFQGVVKYLSGLSDAYGEHEDSERIVAIAQETIDSRFYGWLEPTTTGSPEAKSLAFLCHSITGSLVQSMRLWPNRACSRLRRWSKSAAAEVHYIRLHRKLSHAYRAH